MLSILCVANLDIAVLKSLRSSHKDQGRVTNIGGPKALNIMQAHYGVAHIDIKIKFSLGADCCLAIKQSDIFVACL